MTARSMITGLLPKPKAGIWPPPVYEAHYRHLDKVTAHTTGRRKVRMSFWSAKDKEIDATARRETMLEPYHCRGGRMVAGYVCQGSDRAFDYTPQSATVHELPKPKRTTAKQAREALGVLLACLDGSVTDHDQIRAAVVAARAIAA